MDRVKEAESHYDRQASSSSPDEIFQPKSLKDKVLIKAHQHFVNLVREVLSEKKKGKILDFGCGTGNKTRQFADNNWEIFGIDISSVSVKKANAISAQKSINAHYEIMNCEQLLFNDCFFDIVIDYGTLSSLDIKKAVPEIVRVLKPDGILISIETLGENPFFNFNRLYNLIRKRHTKWSARHIMKLKEWDYVERYFKSNQKYFFGILTPFLIPLLYITPEKIQLKIIETTNEIEIQLLKFKFLRKYCFKCINLLRLKQN